MQSTDRHCVGDFKSARSKLEWICTVGYNLESQICKTESNLEKTIRFTSVVLRRLPFDPRRVDRADNVLRNRWWRVQSERLPRRQTQNRKNNARTQE